MLISSALLACLLALPVMASPVPESSVTLRDLSTRAMSLSDLSTRRRESLTGAADLATVPAQYQAGMDGMIARLSTQATAWLNSMQTLPNNVPIWSDLPLSGVDAPTRSANLGSHYDRMALIATAYATPKSALYNSATVPAKLQQAITALDSVYGVNKPWSGNWWFWEIGIPRAAGNILALVPSLDGSMLTAACRYYAPNPGRRGSNAATGMLETGANLVDKALNTALRGIASNNATELVLARDALSGTGNSVFTYVNTGDGFYRDGSYVQHSYLPYTGTYGVVALDGLAQMFSLLAGSDWQITDQASSMVFDVIEKTFVPYLYNGRMMDVVRGRAVSRQREPDYVYGFNALVAIRQLARAAPADTGARLLSYIKGAAERYTGPEWTGSVFTVAGAASLLNVKGDTTVSPLSRTIGSYLHAGHERMVHHRPGWSFSAALSSRRIGRFEWGNNENGKGWYQGDGLSYLYIDADQGQFSDDFWPTVDSLALPGITSNSVPRKNAVQSGTGIPRATNAFNGGVVLNNAGVSIGSDLTGFSDTGTTTLSMLKSYFAFDTGVVALGSEISDSSGTDTVTVLENRGFAIGSAPTPEFGKCGAVDGTWSSWAVLPNTAGYLLLTPDGGAGQTPATARFSKSTLSGKWSDINTGGTTSGNSDVKTRDYLRLDVLHGVNPTNASYAYLIVPSATAADMSSLWAAPGVQTAIAPKAHFARDNKTCFANFFAAGSVANISATAPASVGWTVSTNQVSIAVSDPTKSINSVTVTFPFAATAASGERVTVVSLSPLRVTVDTSASPRGVPINFTATV